MKRLFSSLDGLVKASGPVENSHLHRFTGITQDEVHAKVMVHIPWKLTTFALEIKTSSGPERQIDGYIAPWEELLRNHGASGASDSVIPFQKFDDGWRITDKDGKTEKDI